MGATERLQINDISTSAFFFIIANEVILFSFAHCEVKEDKAGFSFGKDSERRL